MYGIKSRIVVVVVLFLLALMVVGLFFFYQIYFKDNFSVFRRRTTIAIPKDKVKKITLENGMTILVFENKSVPKVLVQIAYNIGSSIEQPDERGLAHLIEHMIFKGTQKLSEGDIDAIARKYGAKNNAFTSKDVTSYYFEANSSNWKHFIPILADCMVNARFDEQHLASEVRAVIQELKQIEDSYWRVMLERAGELAYPSNHPYHFPIIGYKDGLLNLSSERLKNFYEKYYQPNHATLFIVGDVDGNEAIEFAKKNFESIKSKPAVEASPFPTVSLFPSVSQTKIYRKIDKPLLGFYWLAPGLKDKTFVELQSLESVLGEGEGGRLYRRLVDEEKVASSVVVGSNTCMQSSVFLVLIEPKEEEIVRCRFIVEEEVESLIKDGVTTEELNKVSATKLREFFETFQNFGSFVYEWILSYFSTGDEFELFERANKFTKIDSSFLQSFAKEYLDPFLMSEIQVLPLPKNYEGRALEASRQEDALDMQILNKHKRTTRVEEPKYVYSMPDPAELSFSFPKPEKVFTLKNGLKVLLHKKPDWPLLSVALGFKDAAYLERAKEGRPLNLMMNMLMEGSKGFSKRDNVKFFEDEGIIYGFDSSGIGLTMVSENIVKVLERLLHIIQNPTFPSDALDKLKAISIDSYERAKDDPLSVAGRLLRQMAYKDHSFGWSFDDAMSVARELSTKDLSELHKKYFSPSSMVLSVVGDIDLDKIERDIKGVFEGWKGDIYHPLSDEEYKKSGVEKVDHFMLRNQVVLLLGKRSEINLFHKDFLPLQLLNSICWATSLGSRLFKLREETGLFYTAGGGWATGVAKHVGVDYIFAILSLDTIDKSEKAIRDLVDKIAKEGVSQEELDVARQIYLKSLIDSSSTNYGLASKFCSLESLGLGFDYYDKMIKRVNKASLEELNSVAKKYYSPEKLSRIRVGRVGKN